MRWLKYIALCLLIGLGAAPKAGGQIQSRSPNEAIVSYLVEIDLLVSGDLDIKETITVNAQGNQIRRGIFRDLPRLYEDEQTGGALRYRYDVKEVLRNGRKEPYERETVGNARRIRIGNPEQLLTYGEHTYVIRYSVKNAVKYREGFDELYWNVLAHYWSFPINTARVVINLPKQARPIEVVGYSGKIGLQGQAFTQEVEAGRVTLETTQSYGPGEGLSVSISLEKGIIDLPSTRDKGWLWWARHSALGALLVSFFGLFWFLYRSFDKVGRDPAKGPVFPQYGPPEGYSPAAVHHIYHRRMSGHDALIASFMQLGVKGYLDIKVEKRGFRKFETAMTLLKMPGGTSNLPHDTTELAKHIFERSGDRLVLDGEPDQGFVDSYTAFRSDITKRYGTPYFKWNVGYCIIGAALSIGAIVYAVLQPSLWTGWHTAGLIGLVALNLVFMYLMPAPSKKGQKIRTDIEGFKLYLETAEKLQLNAVEVGSGGPPPMSQERYEQFLPYAIALGVERPWTRHFEKLVPDAVNYDPAWSNMSARGFRSLSAMNAAMNHSLSSGVTGAMPTSSGSGAGGGGFSGGGGGGGGGGGW